MNLTRVIPCLLYDNGALYKTVNFKKRTYIGDPLNAIKIFNEKEVDELILLDTAATANNREPNFKFIESIASECFMPLCYGGGIHNIDQISRILYIGVEKVSLNSAAIENPKFIENSANKFGSQAIVVSIDVKKNLFGTNKVVKNGGKKLISTKLLDYVKQIEDAGAGEILLTSVDREGTWEGYDLDMLRQVAEIVSIPVIANGGAGCVQHLVDAKILGKASALALGSMVVFQKKGMGVLINYPDSSLLDAKVGGL